MNNDSALTFSLKVTVHRFEGESNFSAPFHVCFKLDGKEVGRLQLGTPSVFPLSKTFDTFQLIVIETSTNRSLGSLSMALEEVHKLKKYAGKHWVTLFEDPDDDIYDGNYMEDDAEVPRLLISYEIVKTKVTTETTTFVSKKEEKVPEVHDEVKTETVTSETKIGEDNVVYTVTRREETVTKRNTKVTSETKEMPVETKSSTVTNTTNTTNTKTQEIEMPKVDLKLGEEKNILEKSILDKTIKELKEANDKLRNEINNLEDKKKEFLGKYQTELKDYDKRISDLLKDKCELQQKVAGLENDIETGKDELKSTTNKLEQMKDNNKIESMAITAEMKVKIAQYETTIEDYKRIIDSQKTEVKSANTGDKKMDLNDYLEKLKELERTYIALLNELKAKFEEAENRVKELTQSMQEKDENEKMMKEKILKLEEQNKLLARLRDDLQDNLNISNRKISKLESEMIENEKKAGMELGSLSQKNIELTSLVEQLKAMLEQSKRNNEDFENIIAEKDAALNSLKKENEQLRNRFNRETELLKNELQSKTQLWETENNSLRKEAIDNSQETAKLKAKIRQLENELLKKSSVEEKLADKDRMINSLEAINEEYKNSNEILKNKNKEYEMEIERLRTEIKELQAKCIELQRHVTTFEEHIKKITYELNVKNNDLQEQQLEAAKKDAKSKEDQAEIEKLKNQLKNAEQKLNDTITEKEKLHEKLGDLEEKEKEIESLKAKNKSKEEKLQEITTTLMQQNKLSWEMEAQLHQAQEELDNARAEMGRTLEENEELRNELADRDKEIEGFTTILANQKQNGDTEESKNSQIIYTSDKSDKVDQMFALYINAVRCPVKLKRIAEGQYIFGTKKIYAKIQNEKLIIRVGGGYMMIDDFLATYTAQELSKMNRTANNDLEPEPAGKPPRAKATAFEAEPEVDTAQSVIISDRKKGEHAVFTKSTSKAIGDKARNRARSPGLMNGTNRTRVLTEHDLANSKMVRVDPKGAKKGGEEKENTTMAK